MQQIVDWLEKLGMSEYIQRFAENRIDVSVLPELTDQHLKDLGVALGDRLKMLRSIRELTDAISASPQPAQSEPKPQDTAERRQVTVMFSDLVGSTALSARMDPEDFTRSHFRLSEMRRRDRASLRRVRGQIHGRRRSRLFRVSPSARGRRRAGGARGTGIGRGSERAQDPRVALQTRVGIATGLVVVGDLIGSGEAQERGIVGETPNLAARLQGIAEPNMVVIADGTRKLLGNLFELEDLGAKDLKGIAGPVRA